MVPSAPRLRVPMSYPMSDDASSSPADRLGADASAADVPDVTSGDGTPDTHAPQTDAFPIVGIGASAGGLKAIQAFFSALPAQPDMAFVIVQHLSPDHESALAELVQTQTQMGVSQVDDHPDVAPNRVYVIPPGKHLEIQEGRLRLVELRRERGRPAAVDHFFRSLADDVGERAVCVVLSGTGSDGSLGLKAVRERTGLTMAQSPESAEYAGMPENAIGTGFVDYQGTPDELARKLVDVARGTNEPLLTIPDEAPADEQAALQVIFSHLRRRTAHDFSDYKRATILRRLARRMQVTGQHDLAAYADFLHAHPDETHALLRDFLISVTQFFRDDEAFRALEAEAVPALFRDKGAGDQVRVWVSGCATGEEAYSVAMLLCEYRARMDSGPDLQVFATDIDEDALARAREGLYPRVAATDLSPERLQQFFEIEPGGIRVKPEIREVVLFAAHNLISDPPFSRLDLITCRNVLIYLNRSVQAHAFSAFHYALRPSGLLFLGSSEAPDLISKGFAEVDKSARLYRRRDAVQPQMPRFAVDSARMSVGATGRPSLRASEATPDGLVDRYQDWTLQSYAPPRLLVDEHHDITHVFGQAQDYLRERQGAVTQNVLDKVLRAFRIDLRAALHRAFAKGQATDTPFQQVEVGGRERVVRLHVGPVGGAGAQDGRVEVVFVELDPTTVELLGGSVAEQQTGDDSAVARLEDELRRSRSRLQATIEEQESSNEELRASNEELQSINEELQSTTEEVETSKEELQSLNEELSTVNQELRNKIEEAARSNADLRNLLASTGIGTVYLDRSLRLKRYTPGATDLFHVIPSDVGRPFAHVAHRFAHDGLAERAAAVLETLVPVEEEVETDSGGWFLARVIPYRTADDRIDGVVLSFVDITDLKRARDAAARLAEQQAGVAQMGMAALDAAPLPALFERAAATLATGLGADFANVLRHRPERGDLVLEAGVGWTDAVPGSAVGADAAGSQGGYTLASSQAVVVRDLQEEARFSGPDLLAEHGVRSGISVTIAGAGKPYGVLGVYAREPGRFTDADVQFVEALASSLGSAVRRAADEDTIRQQLSEIEAIYDAAPVGLAFMDRDKRYVRVNERLADINGRAVDEHVGRTARDVVPSLAEELEPLYDEVLRSGDAIEDLEVTGATPRNPQDERVWLCSFVPQLDEHGETEGLSIVVRDITERKRTEALLAATAANLDLAMVGGRMGAWTVDYTTDPPAITFGERAAEIYGMPLGSPLADGLGRIHPEDRAVVAQAVRRATDPALEEDAYRVEYRFLMPDGHYRWCLTNARATFDGDGDGDSRTPRRLDGVIIDIDAVKRNEASLARALYQLNVVLESARVGTWQGDPATDTFTLDARAQELTGLGQEVTIDRARVEVHPDYREPVRAAYQRLRDPELTGPFAFEAPVTGADGAARWLSLRGRISSVGGGKRWVEGVVLDVTARREAEQRVRRQLAEVESYFDALPVGIAVFDREGRYVRVNRQLARLTGRTPQDLIGERARELWPQYAGSNEPHLQHVLRTAEPVLNVEMRLPLPSDPVGEPLDWLVSFYPLRENDEVSGVSVVIQDVTEIRAAEAELERLAASLERRVEQRTAQVRKLAADLTHAEQGERQRVAEVLHDDLQQLLYALQIRSDLLAEALHDSEHRDLVADFSDLLHRALHTTRSLTVDLSPPVQQGEGLEGSLRWLSLQFKEAQEVEVDIEGQASISEPDVHTLLFRSVRELLFNVVKHAGVDRATVRLDQRDGVVRVEIRDDGRGFDPDTLDPQARGFGLFSVRERLGLIGGEVAIESAPGEGTRVTITCPADEGKGSH